MVVGLGCSACGCGVEVGFGPSTCGSGVENVPGCVSVVHDGLHTVLTAAV